MEAVFYCCFCNGDQQDSDGSYERHLCFYVANVLEPVKEIRERLSQCAQDLEETYGARNWHIAPAFGNVMGYTYDVKEQTTQDKVMQAWRDVFVREWSDCTVGVVCELPTSAINNAALLEFTKTAHEQQQAQQLRDTLNTHICSSDFVVYCKKM